MKTVLVFLVLLTVGGLGACSKVSSEDVALKAMYFTMVLHNNNGAAVECYTRVSVSNELGSSIELQATDQLTCNGRLMQKHDDLGYIYYTAMVPAVTNGSYEVVFSREGQLPLRSTNQLPAALVISQPVSGFVQKSNAPLEIRWTTDEFKTDLVRSMISANYQIADQQKRAAVALSTSAGSGGVTLMALTANNPQLPSQVLTAEVEVLRTRKGKVAEGLKGHFDAESIVILHGNVVP